jgi:NAD(P)H dehydrogenase (quinone)
MIAITGATGQLGRLVIGALLRAGTEPADIAALVRNPAKAHELPAGIVIRKGDYGDRASLDEALKGVDKLLLISSSEIGQRAAQHQNVIDAALAAGVPLVAYTSLLHADTSPLGLATEHLATEKALRDSGLQHVLLRNGWYTENYTGQLAGAVERGAIAGSAANGRIASAARADYAEAAARVLLQDAQAGKVYELAGDEAYTLADLAAEAARVSGKPVKYADMPEADYAKVLSGAGLPPPIAEMLADSDAGASEGALFDDDRQLSRLIGHPTTPWKQSVAEALR